MNILSMYTVLGEMANDPIAEFLVLEREADRLLFIEVESASALSYVRQSRRRYRAPGSTRALKPIISRSERT